MEEDRELLCFTDTNGRPVLIRKDIVTKVVSNIHGNTVIGLHGEDVVVVSEAIEDVIAACMSNHKQKKD